MTRSEELCKLLGIEPNWVNITCKGLECKNKCNLFVLPSDKCRKIEKGEPCQYIYRYKEIYPNLTKSSNFVKLLNLVYKCGINSRKDFNLASMSCEEDNCTLAGIEFDTFEDEWLEYIAHMMSRTYDSWDRKFIEITKHQAQATKWDY